MSRQGTFHACVDHGIQGSEKTTSLFTDTTFRSTDHTLKMSSPTSSFSAGHYKAIEVVTRTASVLSVLGSFFIVGTFIAFPYFRKPINRLIFYATFGNLMVNIATLISTSALPLQGSGDVSRLCEFQGVLIQWFMSADACWDFCMATNVLLVFFFGYNSDQLHKLEKWYFLLAYGIPGIPAIIFVILDHTGQSVVGPAVIWCWISREHDWMRIAFFYAPVWLVIAATFAIYVATGVHIYRKRALLRDFSKAPTHQPDMGFSPVVAEVKPSTFGDLRNIVVTTEIGYSVDGEPSAKKPASSEGDEESMSSYSSTRNFPGPSKNLNSATASTPLVRSSVLPQDVEKAMEPQKNPNQSGGHGKSSYRATAFATPSDLPPINVETTNRHPKPHAPEGNEAAMTYLKVAMLMFVAMFMIWVPSTINRLYSFVYKGQPNYGLNLSSVVVLPLQGAWAATIYAYTSRSETRRAYSEVLAKLSGRNTKHDSTTSVPCADHKDTMNSSCDTHASQADIALAHVSSPRERVRHVELVPQGRRNSMAADTA
ncbi:hypothetical protein IAQ61_009462 [Plenodomus lingam]|uniref:G-protein coupled receptors family 2 profile 2 domain-containing protein n=1 Tax=Leptosphaeria maculans (strain JN3 / isolate v23.1.3 / race Av1-4-5-6-7-8) TaxID=985895 RepID=E4ZTE8_LEPMJ|nr:hypothetical protein LEMA_P118070.1 [Plenodomus lingam JN3]KAH9863185.1 hypothetical protein IAQ61_009462 [Plenodomus lingam]CBX94804.1 hypothetical protein LEMA_P118070.1 [Plenodomus lingam JN3]